MTIEYKHGRVYATRDSADGLTREIWVFDRATNTIDATLATTVRLRAFFAQARPSRRHTFRGVEARSWVRFREPRDTAPRLPAADVPLPDEVREGVLALVRELVTLEGARADGEGR